MCGIAGYVNLKVPIDKEYISPMLQSIVHRGPDDQGVYFDKHAALGMRRLSIIDLQTGHQPICNEDKSVWVVFNGEIYNFRELTKKLQKQNHIFATKTDTEVLVHLYEQYGEDFPSHLNGMFAFALWDKTKQKLILGRDHAGIKPLYVYQKDDEIVFGSELKAIIRYSNIRKQVNPEAVNLYSFLGYIPQPFSIFKNIFKLKPGSLLSFSRTEKRTRSFWDFKTFNNPRNTSLHELLKHSVALQSRADVPLGVFLSGGIDSSLITYYLSQIQKKKIKTFSLSFEEKSFDESKYFNAVAKKIGTEHYNELFGVEDALSLFPKVMEQMDEPFADPSLLPTYKLSALARRHVKVVLSGDGGDELFGGYPTYQGHIVAHILSHLPMQLFHPFIKFLQQLPVSFTNYPLQEKLLMFVSGLPLTEYHRHLLWMSIDKTNSVQKNAFKITESNWYQNLSKNMDELPFQTPKKMQVLDYMTYLPDDLLVKVDRASMFNSLEVRVPFLDIDIISFAFLGNHKHLDLFSTKKLLRELLANELPKDVVKRSKKGFGIPVSAWICTSLKDMINDLLKNPDLYDYFDKKMILESWRKHQRKEFNYGRRIWMLAVFSAWLRNWKTR